MNAKIESEIIALHTFFEDWFNARVPNTDESFARIEDALSSDFGIVSPEGRLVEREALLKGLRDSYGTRQGLRIWIENIQIRMGQGELWLATYEEWQGAGNESKGRISTVVFIEDPAAPGGLRWKHVHETFPPDVRD